jgi:hypothetical protein
MIDAASHVAAVLCAGCEKKKRDFSTRQELFSVPRQCEAFVINILSFAVAGYCIYRNCNGETNYILQSNTMRQ